MTQLTFEAVTEAETDRLGAALAEALPSRATVALVGTLGAGKTRLVQAIAAACGIDRREVTSPTFVLLQQYQGTRSIYHLDAYRLAGEEELDELGSDELFESDALVLVEWADRVRSRLPAERIEIRIEPVGPCSRLFEIMAVGRRCEPVIERLKTALGGESQGGGV